MSMILQNSNFLRSGDIYQVQVLYENEPVMVPFTVTDTKKPNYNHK